MRQKLFQSNGHSRRLLETCRVWARGAEPTAGIDGTAAGSAEVQFDPTATILPN